MDIFFLEAVVRELATALTGARVNKVHQPNRHDIIIRFWTGREDLRLLLSTAPDLSRLHLTGQAFPNPPAPPRFCQLLRARIASLEAIEQVPDDRIVRLRFRGPKGEGRYVLVAELIGRHANLILLDEQGRIVDALQRVPGVEGGRQVLPGQPYRLPDAPVRQRLADSLPRVPESIESSEELRRWLLAEVSPMSPLVAGELAARYAKGGSAAGVLSLFREEWLDHEVAPCTGMLDGELILSPFRFEGLLLENVETFATCSEAADAFYYPKSFAGGAVGDRGELEKAVRRELKRIASRLKNIRREHQELQNTDLQRKRGELLLANRYLLQRGMEKVEVDDYYTDPPQKICIRLETRLTPQENIDLYFKRSRKGKRGLEHVVRREEESLEEQQWLEGVALALDEAGSAGELTAIRDELVAAGMVADKEASWRRAPKTGPDASTREALSPSGFRLVMGKNNHGNDHVSKQLTAAEDLWFHAHRLPGCHLVLKRGDRKGEVPEEDILYAASLAAGYSRGKNDSKVEVSVCEGKKVRKPKGARPGAVLADHYRTVLVPPRRLEGEV